MREAMLRVGIEPCSEDERDPGVIGGETKVSACPSLQVAGDRNRTETMAATSKVPMRVALGEAGMLSSAEDAPKIAAKEEGGRRSEDHVISC